MNTLVHDVEAKLTKWGYGDRPLDEAILLYQVNHAAQLQDLCRAIHRRNAIPDGDLGPATALLMNTRFCDCSDIRPGAAVAEANWPTACRNDITISWNFVRLPGLSEIETTKIWQEVKEEYERLFEMGIILRPEHYPDTQIHAGLKALPGPTLAWSYLATSNCGDRLQQAYDDTIKWSFALGLGTVGHEIGHAFGLEHTPNDPDSLMYPSMRGQTTLNKTDIKQMVQKGYVRRTEPLDPTWGMF